MLDVVTAKEFETAGTRILESLEKDLQAVPDFADAMAEGLGKSLRRAWQEGVALVLAVAAQLPGALRCEEDDDARGHHLIVYKGDVSIARLTTTKENKDPTHGISMGFVISLSKIAAAVHESTCPCHKDAASDVLKAENITLNKQEN